VADLRIAKCVEYPSPFQDCGCLRKLSRRVMDVAFGRDDRRVAREVPDLRDRHAPFRQTRQTTVVSLAPVFTDMPTYDPRQLAYRDIVASWSMTPPSPHRSGAWNEVLDVESRGPFQPFPSITALPRLTAIIDRMIDVPAPLPRWATAFLSAPNQPHFEFSAVGETTVQG